MKLRRIDTDSLETALEQIIRIRTSGDKASIKPAFVAELLKELIDRRREEELILAEVEEIFGEEVSLRVEEVMSLDELGNSSWQSGSDLHKIKWKKPEPLELDESDVVHEVHHRPILRAKSKHSGMHVRGRWHDGSGTRRTVVYALLCVILLTFGSLLAAY